MHPHLCRRQLSEYGTFHNHPRSGGRGPGSLDSSPCSSMGRASNLYGTGPPSAPPPPPPPQPVYEVPLHSLPRFLHPAPAPVTPPRAEDRSTPSQARLYSDPVQMYGYTPVPLKLNQTMFF